MPSIAVTDLTTEINSSHSMVERPILRLADSSAASYGHSAIPPIWGIYKPCLNHQNDNETVYSNQALFWTPTRQRSFTQPSIADIELTAPSSAAVIYGKSGSAAGRLLRSGSGDD